LLTYRLLPVLTGDYSHRTSLYVAEPGLSRNRRRTRPTLDTFVVDLAGQGTIGTRE